MASGVEVREAGRALRFQTESPHLVSMGSGRLSTAVTLHPLPEGNYKKNYLQLIKKITTKNHQVTLNLSYHFYRIKCISVDNS